MRICREAGARVASEVLFRDVPLTDGCRTEALANGVSPRAGAALVSPVTRAGGARLNADRIPGAALEQVAKRKGLHAYPEVAVARQCKLVVLGWEVGGRFSREANRAALLHCVGHTSSTRNYTEIHTASTRASALFLSLEPGHCRGKSEKKHV